MSDLSKEIDEANKRILNLKREEKELAKKVETSTNSIGDHPTADEIKEMCATLEDWYSCIHQLFEAWDELYQKLEERRMARQAM